MSATEVVAGMYDIIAGDDGVSPDEIYLSLLSMGEPTFNDVNRLCRGTGVSPNDLQERAFFDTTDGFTLLRWHDEQRMAYLQAKAPDELSALERVQLLRYAADEETKPREESCELEVTGAMMDVASELADITGDETFRQILRD